jgi:hypothetical protein
MCYFADETAPRVWLMTDACINGITTVIVQGADWKTANIAAFFSAKLSTAQQNYPVHKQEMLAGVEGMLRYRDVLQGVSFTWVMDHKGLIHLYHQKNLSGRQARWIEKISEYDFVIEYLLGVENILPDALSQLYSNDVPGTVRASSEYVQHAKVGINVGMTELLSMPLLVGLEVGGPNNVPRHSTRVATKALVCKDIPPVAQKPQQRRKDKPSHPLPTHGREDILTDADPPPGIGGSGPSCKRPVGQQPDRTLMQVGGSVDAGTGTKRRTRKVVLPAETGRLETSAEFARRVKNQFVLKGPRERTEGGRSPISHLPLKRAASLHPRSMC